MSNELVRDAVHDTIRRILPDIGPLHDGQELKEDLGMDSAQFVDLVIELEERFKLEIAERDILKLKSVGSCIEYLTENLTGKDNS